jgi:formate/nitrite transporter FocA (FNT family)
VSDERRAELGDSDAPVEDEIAESFDAVVELGAQRLNRRFRILAATGLAGGLEIGTGVMAYLAVLHTTSSQLLAGLAFGIGFVALLLAKSELFTENFLLPIAAVAAKEGTLRQLATLWAGTLVTNLLAGWLFMWLVVLAFPDWRDTIVTSASTYVDAGFSPESIALAVLGGSAITLMTRMQSGTDSEGAKVVAAFAGGFLLTGVGLFHSILDSLLIFGALELGSPVTYGGWLGWFLPTLLFNVLGGVLLVTALRLFRTKELVQERRRASRDQRDGSAGPNV